MGFISARKEVQGHCKLRLFTGPTFKQVAVHMQNIKVQTGHYTKGVGGNLLKLGREGGIN